MCSEIFAAKSTLAWFFVLTLCGLFCHFLAFIVWWSIGDTTWYFSQEALAVLCGSEQMFFPLLPSRFYDYDEPIGMCSRLIIHNLTRASSGCRPTLAQASLPLFDCRFFFICCCWHAAGNENSDSEAPDDSAKCFVHLLIATFHSTASCFRLPHCVLSRWFLVQV